MAARLSPSIFLVEDDPAVVEVVREGVEGLQWRFRNHGMLQGALDALREFNPDLVLLDLILPDGDGSGICERMREDAKLAKIPIIVLTSRREIETRLKCFAAGARDYVIKPVLLDELLARMRAHLEIKSREDDLARRLDESQLRERVRQDMLDMVVHDLRSPLATIRMTLQWLGSVGAIGGKQCQYFLGVAEHSADDALLMVNDLLDLGSGRLQVNPAAIDLARLIARLESLWGVQYAAKGVALTVHKPSGGTVVTDETLVFRALGNLLGNALKFSKAKTGVRLQAAGSAKGLRLEVVDQGPGIPDQEKEAVFDKYFRGEDAQTKGIPGAGIGLAFCRMACQALGGKIWVEDAAGGGSCFIIELPALKDESSH